MKKINIAIDGFSGCGKSSTAKEVAKRLAYKFIDSGAMYRAVTLYMLQNKVDIKDEAQVMSALEAISIDFRHNPQTGKSETFLNGAYVEEEIRKMYVSEFVSPVAAIKAVRVAMVAQQQEMGKYRGVVMDGRDIASVVFPDAELKIFMKASDEARAKRRQAELEEKGEEASLEEIVKNFRERDLQDSNRKESPLIQVPEAIVIDTSHLEFEDQVNKVLTLANEQIEG
ncbi:cytidylate kinase [Roseivirga seohaensis]|uniref:Cytidylate kinase n=1 Tax=Roseivirga seohaensis TaxID=1914963 RepID=A0A150XMW4_9BACT|nr:(d)CMP kinase [Roseivirga seohaensis]KYG79962.1 cytidylate kinase [Roseivirga seohaensis]